VSTIETGLSRVVACDVKLGKYPDSIEREPERLFETVDKPLDVGVPAALLRNRPDVRQAELELEAARCDVAAARAAFFPDLTITAGLGLQAFNPGYLFDLPKFRRIQRRGRGFCPTRQPSRDRSGFYGR
jgi:outer membrane protein TolC